MVSNENKISTGRGGAGNIGSPKIAPKSDVNLETPTLKTSVYTTGRGGAGNMAHFEKNDPNEARVAQDVEPPQRHEDPHAAVVTGRGGTGNIVKGDSDDRSGARSKRSNSGGSTTSNGSRRRRSSSIVDKGREMLHKIRDASASRKAVS
ncbi:MAG: hypothetical protein M1831_004806 [Alyxoria varia]|nr:MAG: hypothetical protein M1831_004806 [Alyxoria varia]